MKQINIFQFLYRFAVIMSIGMYALVTFLEDKNIQFQMFPVLIYVAILTLAIVPWDLNEI
jgi:hypothetical protein